ncbi:hypothetical protein FOZ60_007337, partial [Perkinsus olseni]
YGSHVDASYGGGALPLKGKQQERRLQINRYADLDKHERLRLWPPTGLHYGVLRVKSHGAQEKRRMTAAFAATGDYLPRRRKRAAAFGPAVMVCPAVPLALQGLTERIEAKGGSSGVPGEARSQTLPKGFWSSYSPRSAALAEGSKGDDQGFEANANPQQRVP